MNEDERTIIAERIFDICKDALSDWQCYTNTDNFDFDLYKVRVAAWLDERWSRDKRDEYIKTTLNLDGWWLASRDFKFYPRVTRDTIELLRRLYVRRIDDWHKISNILKAMLELWKPDIFEDKSAKMEKRMLELRRELSRRNENHEQIEKEQQRRTETT